VLDDGHVSGEQEGMGRSLTGGIRGHHLPGQRCGPYSDVHVGLQVRRDPEGLVPGDAEQAEWVSVHADGEPAAVLASQCGRVLEAVDAGARQERAAA
jgi:hypothetical protein